MMAGFFSFLFFFFGKQVLLHRDVEMTLEGQLDKRGTYYGSVILSSTPNHNISSNWAEELLRGGWAK